MGLGDAIARHVDVVDGAHLEHDFVDHGGGCALVDVADVDGGLFVLLPGKEEGLERVGEVYGVKRGIKKRKEKEKAAGRLWELLRGKTYQCLLTAILTVCRPQPCECQ